MCPGEGGVDVLSIWEREPSAHMSHWINDDPLSMGTPSPFFNGLIATPLDSPDGRGGMRQPRGYGAMHDVHADDLDDDFGSDGDDFSDGGRRGRGGYDDLDDEEEDGDIEMSERDDPFEEEPGFLQVRVDWLEWRSDFSEAAKPHDNNSYY